MTPIAATNWKLAPKTPSRANIACVQALAAVWEELLAIPAAEVVRPDGEERTLAGAEQAFDDLESLARLLVRRGVLRRCELPRRTCRVWTTALDDRCRYICELIEVLAEREHEDGDVPQELLHRAERLARQLEGARPAVGPVVSAREVRDRAYTALRTALNRTRRAALDAELAEGSGVFVIDMLDGALAGVRYA